MNLYYEYNKPVRFDGDIIITDPCYLIRGEKENPFCLRGVSEKEKLSYPQWDDFYSFGLSEDKYPDYQDAEVELDMEKDTLEILTLVLKQTLPFEVYDSAEKSGAKTITVTKKQSQIYQECRRNYDEAFKQYNSIPHDDRDYTNYGEEIDKIGITTSLISDTMYGDWSCTVVNSDTKEKLGSFCADAGEVGVFLLSEVKAYWPEKVEEMMDNDELFWATIIKDFHGDIQIVDEVNGEQEVSVVGNGNINFKTIQTGF